nr:MAG TPA: iron(III) ABC transporter [Crassvirales sp.]
MVFSDKIHHNHAGTRSSLPASPPTIYTIIVMVVLYYI